jgi:HK97 family phage major capsid protein
LIKVSRRLAQLTPNIDQIVNDRMAYKFGVAEESAFFTGNGVNQPLGVMTTKINNKITTTIKNIGATPFWLSLDIS